MSDPSDAEPSPPQRGAKEPTPYLRLPWYVVAAALVLVLGAALAIGLNATRSTPSEPAAAPPPATSTPPIPTAAIATATAPAPAAAATAPPPAPATVTPAPTPLILSLASTATPMVPLATEIPTPLPTVEPTLAAEVGAAYENFWRIRSQALLELDPSHLPEVMGGDYLQNVQNLIDQLRTEGHAIKTQVSLNYRVVEATTQNASVVDSIDDNSIYVTIGTEDPLNTSTTDHLRILYRFRRLDEAWKVVDSVRSE